MDSCRIEDSSNTDFADPFKSIYTDQRKSVLACPVAAPDFGFGAFLTALDACAAWDFFRVAGGGFFDVATFVFRNLGERTSR